MRTLRISAFLLAIICCLPLIACGSGGGEITTEPSLSEGSGTALPETEPEITEMPDLALNGYAIIRSEDAKDDEIKIFAGLRSYFREKGGFDITISEDFLLPGKDPGEKEIVCGLNNRPESNEALASIEGYYDYGIIPVGTKLCISAHTVEGLNEATEYLKENLRIEGETVYYTGGAFICRKDYPLADAKIGTVSVKDFKIIYASDNDREKNIAESLSLDFARLTGKKLDVVADSEPETANEIVIGSAKRVGAVDPTSLAKDGYTIAVKDGKLILSAGNNLGYDTVKSQTEALMTENKLAENFTESGKFEIKGLDGAKVMFVGNSFLYYGYCTTTKNKIVFDDRGYFYDVAKAMGDDVYVTAITYGGKGFKSLYDILVDNYPNYYGKGSRMDDFYNQDFVILQQEGSNASSTEEYAEKIMALFPPETRFAFFIHHHNAQNNHTNVIRAAEKLRNEKGVIYISAGHMMVDVWKGNVKVPGATLTYNKNSFVVNHSDSHHPNYLNGYLTALSCYYGLTGNSILDCPHDFVRTTMEYYTKATSNYDKILASEADMRGLKQLVEEYIDKYN